jgi:hypothetical protein
MSRRIQAILLAVVAAVAVAGLALRAIFGKAAATDHAVIVFDRSDSKRGGCDAVVGVAEELFGAGRWRTGSSLVVLATGSAETLGEPVQVIRFDRFERARTVEGRGAAARARMRLLGDLRRRCEDLPTTRVSPVYLGARRGAEVLQARDCTHDRCTLVVVTDGEETSEASVALALRGGAARDAADLPSKVPNSGVRVRLCGLAETTAAPARGRRAKSGEAALSTPKKERLRDGARADRVAATWRALFADPSLVETSPVCPARAEAE